MFNHKCKACLAKDQEIEHLRKIVDNILISKGVAPVVEQAETILEDSEEEKADRALKESGGIRYGD